MQKIENYQVETNLNDLPFEQKNSPKSLDFSSEIMIKSAILPPEYILPSAERAVIPARIQIQSKSPYEMPEIHKFQQNDPVL